jgi:hypothetical protein
LFCQRDFRGSTNKSSASPVETSSLLVDGGNAIFGEFVGIQTIKGNNCAIYTFILVLFPLAAAHTDYTQI